jgi:hypothetical protein
MNSPKPEYIRCIRHTHAERLNTSWCGKNLYSFDLPFQDIDHAVYAVEHESRLVPCPDCLDTIFKIFGND